MIDDKLIHQLNDPACYPGATHPVNLYQTHLSVVCVVGDYAYKLKKPIRLPFVDFSTLEKRKHFCEEETRLNSRLCPEVYLGVSALVATPAGVTFREVAGAEIIDYAVRMRRLPAERMMDVLLAENGVTENDVKQIAAKMAGFHKQVALSGVSSEAMQTVDRLQEFAAANFVETAPHLGAIFDRGLHRLLRDRSHEDFARLRPALRERARSGRVVDGHGDLHARNICLCEPLAIYDCIEFNRDLGIQDVAAENAFLVMDLRYRGHRDLASAYLDHYVAISEDEEQREFIPALLRYRALVRAKVAAIAAGEVEIGEADREGCVVSARTHLNLAAASAVEESGPWFICACGLPATGKSRVFESIGRASGWPRFASDGIRKELAGVAPGERAPDSFYTREFSARTYAELMRRASGGLANGPVLVDANFASRALRQQAIECAHRAGARVIFVWFRADEKEIERRMRERAADPGRESDADIGVYRRLKSAFEPPSELGEGNVIISEPHDHREQQAAAIFRQLLDLPSPR